MKQSNQKEDAVEEEWISFIDFNFDKAKKINLPVHLIHGGLDILLSTKQTVKLQTLFPSATLDIIPEAGHVPPVETPKSLYKVLSNYLA